MEKIHNLLEKYHLPDYIFISEHFSTKEFLILSNVKNEIGKGTREMTSDFYVNFIKPISKESFKNFYRYNFLNYYLIETAKVFWK